MIGLLPLLLAIARPETCRMLDAESVLARDVVAAVPEFAQLPPDFLLGYVASSGGPKVFHGADLERIAKNRGVELHGLPDVCFARKTFIPNESQIREAMNKSLGIPNAKIEVVSSSQHEAPSGELVFPRSGIQSPLPGQTEVMWHGFVRFGESGRFPVSARVRITATMTRVVAISDLAPGKLIQPSQLRIESVEDSPLDETATRSLDEVAGYLCRASVRAGAAIRKSQIERPSDVMRGDFVRVDVFEGSAHLQIEGVAQSSGMKGASIVVRNPSNGKDFRAQIAGKGIATIGEAPVLKDSQQ